MTLTPYAIGFLWFALAVGVGQWLTIGVGVIYMMSRPERDFSNTRICLELLLRRGFDGAHYRFAHSKTDLDLLCRKYIRQTSIVHLKGDYGLELAFPATGWGKPYAENVKSLCGKMGLNPRTVSEGGTDDGETILVDFGRDVEKAYDTCQLIWTRVFGLRDNAPFRCGGHDLFEFDELVDSLHFPRPTKDDIRERQLRESQRRIAELTRKMGRSFGRFLVLILCMFATLIAFVGVPASTLISFGQEPDWRIVVGGIAAGGSYWSLVFLLIFLTCWLWVSWEIRKDFGSLTRYEWALRLLLLPTFVATPIAVLIVWLGA